MTDFSQHQPDWEKHRKLSIWGFTHFLFWHVISLTEIQLQYNVMKRKDISLFTRFVMQLKALWVGISHQVYSDSSAQFYWWSSEINPKPRTERLSECGLDCVDEVHCVKRRSRRTEFLLRDPQTLLFSCWWTLQRVQSIWYCARMSIWRESSPNSRTDHYIQTYTHNPVPSSWLLLYDTDIHTP